jgi:hypothetical protein
MSYTVTIKVQILHQYNTSIYSTHYIYNITNISLKYLNSNISSLLQLYPAHFSEMFFFLVMMIAVAVIHFTATDTLFGDIIYL